MIEPSTSDDLQKIVIAAITDSLNGIGIIYRKRAVSPVENNKEGFIKNQETLDFLQRAKECFLSAIKNKPERFYRENYQFVTGVLNQLEGRGRARFEAEMKLIDKFYFQNESSSGGFGSVVKKFFKKLTGA